MMRAAVLPIEAPDLADPDEPVVEIAPRGGWIGVDWAELVRYRELLSYLVWRDVKVKYKQAVLGVAWSLILPLISLCVYGGVAAAADFRAYLSGEPKPPTFLWMFAGLVPWMFLARAISDGGTSLLTNQPLMTKVYLPRLYLPLAALGNALVDMAVNLSLLAGLGLYFHVRTGWTPTWQVLWLGPLMLLLLVAAMGLSFFLSAATVLYRDLRFLIPFVVQFGSWLSAVVFPLALLPKAAQTVAAFNPLTGIVAGFRSATLGQPWDAFSLGTSVVLCTALLVFGLFYFKRVERLFADIA